MLKEKRKLENMIRMNLHEFGLYLITMIKDKEFNKKAYHEMFSDKLFRILSSFVRSIPANSSHYILNTKHKRNN